MFKLSIRAAEKPKPVSLMKLTQVDDPKSILEKYDEKDIVVEPKIDGWKLQVIKTDGEVHLYSRKGEEKTNNFPELVKSLSSLPDNTMIEGELTYIENGKQDVGMVTSLAGSSAENAAEKMKGLKGSLKIFLYDILWLKGNNISKKPFGERRKALEGAVKKNERIQLTEQKPFSKWEEVMKKAVKEGGEGAVFKSQKEPYEYKASGQSEPKPGFMFKFKGGVGKSDTDDFVVYDYEMSDKGNLKALFGQYYKGKLYHISEISNFSEEDESKIKSKLKKGPFVIEIGFQEKQPGGLRHQKFLRFRDDKKPKDATMSGVHVENIDNFEVAKVNKAEDIEGPVRDYEKYNSRGAALVLADLAIAISAVPENKLALKVIMDREKYSPSIYKAAICILYVNIVNKNPEKEHLARSLAIEAGVTPEHLDRMLKDSFNISKRADFATEVIELLENKSGKPAGKPASRKIQDFSGLGSVPNVDVKKAYTIFSTLESGQNYIVGDSGTAFGSTQVQLDSFINQLSKDPQTQKLTGFTPQQLYSLAEVWNKTKKGIMSSNIWKQVPVDGEKVREFMKSNPRSVIRRREGTSIRMNPGAAPGVVKIVNHNFVGFELDEAKLRSFGIDPERERAELQKIMNEYITDGVVKNALTRLAVAHQHPDLSKFQSIFSEKSVRNNQQLRNLTDRATQRDFMSRIKQVSAAVGQYGYDTTAPGAYNIYQLIGLANANGVPRVIQFLKNRKPFGPGNLTYLQRANKMITKVTGLPAEFAQNGGLGGFKTASDKFFISKRAMGAEEEFEEEPTKTEIDRKIFQVYDNFHRRFKEVLSIPGVKNIVVSRIGLGEPTLMVFTKSIDDSIIEYLMRNREKILANPGVDFFPAFLVEEWGINLVQGKDNFTISKRAEYTEPGVLYFPSNFANEIKEGKRKMTIRAGDVPVQVNEVVKCKTYAGSHICDLYITSKEWMSLNRIGKAFGERMARSLEQKFGKDRRFVVVRFDVYENVNEADDKEAPEIDFPEEEYKDLEKRLRRNKGIYSTRISKDRGKFREGQEYMTPWGHKVKVISVVPLEGLEKHPFIDELTDEQKSAIGNKKYDLVRLEKIIKEEADDEDDKKWDEVLIDKDGVKLTRKQIKNHYTKSDIRKKIMSRIKDNPVLIYIGTGTNEKILKRNHNNKPIVITNDDPEKSESPNNYFYWVERRLLSIHQVFGSKTGLGFVDLDIHGDYSLAEAKKYAKEVAVKIKDKFGATSAIYQSGGTGLHVEFQLKEEKNINDLRAELKEMLDEINEDWDDVSTGIVKGKGMRSDISTLHNKGSIRVPGSLGETYGKVKKPVGSEQDGDDDTFGNTNFGTKYTNSTPENLDEDPSGLDTGAIVYKPDMGAYPEQGVGSYVFSISKRDKMVKEGRRIGVEDEWIWGFGDGRFISAKSVEDEKEIPITHIDLFDNKGVKFIDDEHTPRGFYTIYNNGEEEITTYELSFRMLPANVQEKVERHFGLTPGKFKETIIKVPRGSNKELYAMDKNAQDYLQSIWKFAGILEDDEADLESMLEKQQLGEEGEDEASRWLSEHDPETPPAPKTEKKVKAPGAKVPKAPRPSLHEQLRGEIPEALQTKKPEKKTKHKEETEEITVTPEDLMGVTEEELAKLLGEEPKPEEKPAPSSKDFTAEISSIINSKDFEGFKAKVDKSFDEEGKQFHEFAVGLSHEDLFNYLLDENEYADADKTLREEYIKEVALTLLKQHTDLPEEAVVKEIQRKITSPTIQTENKQEIITGKPEGDAGEQYALDDMLRIPDKKRKLAKPTFAEQLEPPKDEKGNVLQSWPTIEVPPLSDESIVYFHPDNLSDGPSMRKIFADPKAWEALKKQPWLLQKWILPALIMTIGYRWFELNSAKEYVGRRAERDKGLTFKHLQGGAPFAMLDDITNEENIKKLEAGEITNSDLPEAKEYIQHINRLVTELANVYFAKENPSIPIDEYMYQGLQNEMIRIIAEKHGYGRRHVPKCSVCMAEADARTEIEPMTLVGKGLYKCPNCEKIADRLKSDLPEIKDELRTINKRLDAYTDAKTKLESGELSDTTKKKLEAVIKDVEPHVKRFNIKKDVLEKQINDLNEQINLRSLQSRVPYFHTLCPNPTCKLQRIPLTSIDWDDPIWKTKEGEALRKNLKQQYQIEAPAEQNAEEFKLDVPVPEYIPKGLIPAAKLSWIYFVPFKCPYDSVRFKMKDVIGQGYRGMSGFFYRPYEKIMWQPKEERSKKAVEKDPQLDPINNAPVFSALKSVADRAQKAAALQYYDFYMYLRLLDVALKEGKEEFEFDGKIYKAKPLTKKQQASHARELLLYNTISDFVSDDVDAYLNWLAGSELLNKPVYENGVVQNKNTTKRILSYSDKREQIYLPILQKWIDNMMKVPNFMKRFDLSEWLVNTGTPQEDGTFSEDGIPSDGPGTYFVAQVKNSNIEDSNFYGFSCQLESKRRKDEKYKKEFDKKGPRILRVLSVYKMKPQDIKLLTPAQKEGKDAIFKSVAEKIIKDRENLAPEIKSHGFHEVSLDDTKTTLVPNDFVLVRAFVMPGKFGHTPFNNIRDVEKNKRDFEFWKKFYELVRLEQNDPTYWKHFEEKAASPPYLYRLEDLIDRELFKAKTKKKAEFSLSIREAKDPLSTYKKKRDFSETKEPEGKTETGNKHRFVIQNHKAEKAGQHFDLRLENDDGAMSSWAVPKHKMPGDKDKLLAMKVEDHPISYNKFKGTIPEGEYGAGEVEIYDSGTYEEIEWSASKIVFKLKGKKEKGTYNLVKTDGSKWLWMKAKEE